MRIDINLNLKSLSTVSGKLYGINNTQIQCLQKERFNFIKANKIK